MVKGVLVIAKKPEQSAWAREKDTIVKEGVRIVRETEKRARACEGYHREGSCERWNKVLRL